MQVNLLVGRQVASFQEGAVAWLNYADRLYQLPLGVVGIAIGVVLLPDLSRKLSANDKTGARSAFNRAGETAIALALPAAVAFAVVPFPLVSVLFERGAFSSQDSAAAAAALAIYAAGLPAFILQKVVQSPFFAREDTKSPFRYAVASMLLNAVVAIGLMSMIGYLAAAVGTTLSGWLMTWLLWRGSRGMGEETALDREFINRIPRIAAAAAVMGIALWFAGTVGKDAFSAPGIRYFAMAGLVVWGAGAYGAALLVFRAWRPADILRLLPRR